LGVESADGTRAVIGSNGFIIPQAGRLEAAANRRDAATKRAGADAEPPSRIP
jgi:hypothetical protein